MTISHQNQADIIADYLSNYVFVWLLVYYLFIPLSYKLCEGRTTSVLFTAVYPTPRTVASYYPTSVSLHSKTFILYIFALSPNVCLAS